MLRYDCTDLIDKDLSRILIDSENREAFIARIQTQPKVGEMELFFHTRDGAVRQFLVSASRSEDNIVICSTIDITERKLAESVIAKAKGDLEVRVLERTDELLRANEILKAEIHERKRFESAIQLANRKLNTLSSITRHDILNQVTAIVMYLSLAEERVTDPETLEHLQKIEQVIQLIQKQIRFTRDYQNIGSSTPQWQQVSVTVRNAISDLDLEGIIVETELEGLEVYMDSLLEKVFYNIVENSLRHGEKVTKVRFYYKENAETLTLFSEDDGVGIPVNAKDRIFKREYYRNTGYGLFLASEILSITGLTIKETGEPGRGARFEIEIPKGEFRFSKSQDRR